MNAKPPARSAPNPPPAPQPVRVRPTEVELKEKKAGFQPTPDGFPGPTSVLLITARSDAGRPPQHIIELIRTLKNTGIRVFVASPVNPPYGYELKKMADKFIPIPHREFSFSAMMRVRKSILKHHINIIHSHGRTAGVYSRLLGFMTNAAVLHTYHGIQSETGINGQIKLTIDRILAGFKFDPIFASQAERTKALQKGVVKEAREAHIVDNAIDLERFPKRKHNTQALGKVDRAKPETLTQIRVGAILRPESTKGHEQFLKMVQEMKGQATFVCAGMPREKIAKIGAIPDNLEILGPLPDPLQFLYSLDVFVSTSMGDGQVINSLEAMAAGCVCLLSNVVAHEPLEKQHAAVLFDPTSVQSFAKALTDVRNDKALRDMVLENSRYMLERFHDAGTFKSKIMELYRTGAKRHAGLVL